MMTQLELFRRPNKQQAEFDAQIMADYLYLMGGWATRKELMQRLGWVERRVRAAGEAAVGDIIYGQKGMKHILCATQEEFMAAMGALGGQIESMTRRKIATAKKYHDYRKAGGIL